MHIEHRGLAGHQARAKKTDAQCPYSTQLHERDRSRAFCQRGPHIERELQAFFTQAHAALTDTPLDLGTRFWDPFLLIISYHVRKQHATGGTNNRRPYVCIPLARYTYLGHAIAEGDTTLFTHTEYARFEHDPIIGRFKGTAAWVLRGIACHELTHAMQFHLHFNADDDRARLGLSKADLPIPHGAAFQSIYRALRQILINPYLTTLEATA